MNYDIIGDIHGHADAAEALLGHLGYRQRGGAWRHPERQVLFVGDFIDRGPQQRESVELVRRMLDSGSAQAVMGNHEFNAIAWFTEDPECPGEYCASITPLDTARKIVTSTKHSSMQWKELRCISNISTGF